MCESFTKEALNRRYIEWLDKKGSPKIYCTLYPDFIADCFSEGVRIDEQKEVEV